MLIGIGAMDGEWDSVVAPDSGGEKRQALHSPSLHFTVHGVHTVHAVAPYLFPDYFNDLDSKLAH